MTMRMVIGDADKGEVSEKPRSTAAHPPHGCTPNGYNCAQLCATPNVRRRSWRRYRVLINAATKSRPRMKSGLLTQLYVRLWSYQIS